MVEVNDRSLKQAVADLRLLGFNRAAHKSSAV